MSISYRKRGEVWHARGTVRVGREVLKVPEFSTGCRSRADAEAAGEAEARRIAEEHVEGDAGRARRLTLADLFVVYLSRPKGLHPNDARRIEIMSEAMGDRRMADAAQAWTGFMNAHAWAPGTAARWRAVFVAALEAGSGAYSVPPPKVPGIRQDEPDTSPYLPPGVRDRLLRSYNPSAACPALLAAHQGMRVREILQLRWPDIDLRREDILIRAQETKAKKVRRVPMHPRVRFLLVGMWHAAGSPSAGPVFLSSRGEPYHDTRISGGNPLTKAHATACKLAGVQNFRFHDWRHSWATDRILAGVDLRTVQKLGGWASLKMLQRYADPPQDHLRQAIGRAA